MHIHYVYNCASDREHAEIFNWFATLIRKQISKDYQFPIGQKFHGMESLYFAPDCQIQLYYSLVNYPQITWNDIFD